MSLKRLAESDRQLGDAASRGIEKLVSAMFRAIFRGFVRLFKALFSWIGGLVGRTRPSNKSE